MLNSMWEKSMIKLSCDTSKLEKQLMELINNIDKSAESVIKEGCENIKAQAKKLVPVVTGNLRDSIDTEFANKKYKHDGYVYSDVDYALLVELGERNRPPKPYLYPAYKQNEEFFKQRLIELINKGGK